MSQHNITLQLLTIPDNVSATCGEGINVGVCDTGFDFKNVIISKQLKAYRDYTHSNKCVGYDHGTQIAELICKIAPKCNLYLAKTIVLQNGKYDWLIEALSWMNTLELDIINLSLSYKKDVGQIKELLIELNKKCFIVASYGGSVRPYPSMYDCVISVDSFNESDDIDLFVPNEVSSRMNDGNNRRIKGSSISAAYATGLIANILSYHKQNMDDSSDDMCKHLKDISIRNYPSSYVSSSSIV
jgi:hypothetical protein